MRMPQCHAGCLAGPFQAIRIDLWNGVQDGYWGRPVQVCAWGMSPYQAARRHPTAPCVAVLRLGSPDCLAHLSPERRYSQWSNALCMCMQCLDEAIAVMCCNSLNRVLLLLIGALKLMQSARATKRPSKKLSINQQSVL